MSLTVGSLFAGIGGIEMGLEQAGMEVVWQVERDDYCRKVLAKHWPDVERFEDVREVGAENLEPVDLICGGFPCQDISVAGKGEGIEGERSGLWSEMWRILRELRPRYALVENVPALRFRGFGRLLGDLAEIGYNAEWDCLPAVAFGAPHRRDRVFVVAYPDPAGQRCGARQGIPGEQRKALPDHRGLRPDVSHPDGGSPAQEPRVLRGSPLDAPRDEREWLPEPDVARVVDGFSDQMDRRRALGNAVVPQVAEWIGRRIVEHAEASP